MPLLVLLALFIAVPIAELYVIIRVGGEIGVLPTIAILLLVSVVGSVVVRSQGREVWRRFNAAVAAGRMPHREIVDGVMVLAGGALLLTPGFLTDIVGLSLLLPPTRAALRRLALRALGRRIALAAVGGAARGGRPRGSGDPPHDVEGSAVEHEPPGRPPGRAPLER